MVKIEYFPGREDAVDAERAAIKRENPLWNIVHKDGFPLDRSFTDNKRSGKQMASYAADYQKIINHPDFRKSEWRQRPRYEILFYMAADADHEGVVEYS